MHQAGSRHTAYISAHILADVLSQLCPQHDVPDCELAPRLQHAVDLAENCWLVGTQIDNAVADDEIDRVALDWKSLDVAFSELHIARAQSLGIGASACQHVI